MFWKDLSWKVQTEAMGHSFQTTSFSSRPLRSLRDLVLVNFGGLLLPALRVCCLLLGEGKRPLGWGCWCSDQILCRQGPAFEMKEVSKTLIVVFSFYW